jgi:hypothetical protein
MSSRAKLNFDVQRIQPENMLIPKPTDGLKYEYVDAPQLAHIAKHLIRKQDNNISCVGNIKG